MKKLTRDELLEHFNAWFEVVKDTCPLDKYDKQAYTQLKELVEDSDLAAWMDRCHELELQKKPTVTPIEIGKVHDFIMSAQWGPGMFLEWLEQKGMEIT